MASETLNTQIPHTKSPGPRVATVGAVLLGLLFVVMPLSGGLSPFIFAGMAVAGLCLVFHPLVPFALYFAALFFKETPIPGVPVTANQVLAILFFITWGATWLRGRTQKLESSFLPILGITILYFAVSAISGENLERGFLHFKYVLIYGAMAACLAASLTTEAAILSLAWIVTLLSFGAALGGLVEAIQNNVLSAFTGRWTGSVRIQGTAPNSIVFAWNLLYSFPFAFLLYSELRTGSLRKVALLMGMFALFISLLTFNRQTIVMVFVMLALSAMVFVYRNRNTLLAIVAAAAVVGGATVAPLVAKRIFTVTTLERDPSFLERRDSYILGMEMFSHHPVFGVGFGSFPAVYRSYLPEDYTTYYAQYHAPNRLKFPDMGYLALLAETGIVGLGIFLGLMSFLVRRAWTLRKWALARGDTFAANYSSLVLALLVFILMTSGIQDTFLYVRVWIVLGLALLLDRRMLETKPA
ncbi:MAG: O-antigen ligase family protein [Candidatus Sumerlaeaceae bacterium]|nr:O-antigen ligase family protein [Candidatus Sumerlaeaceae bacterium]